MKYKGYIIELTDFIQYAITYNGVRLVFEKLIDAWAFIDNITE